MEEVITSSAASDDEMKRLIDYFKRTKNTLKEARDKTKNGFKEMREERDTIASGNGKCDVDGSEILRINAGGE